MESIFKTSSYGNSDQKFWIDCNSNLIKSKLIESHLSIPKSDGTLKKLKFCLDSHNIYLLDRSGSPKKMSGLFWKFTEPFQESNSLEERFGFRIFTDAVFQDFYAEDQNLLERWITALEKVSLFNQIELDYKFIEELNSGSFGTVYLTEGIFQSGLYAVKCIEKRSLDSPKDIRNLRNEITAGRAAEHPNIAKLLKVYESSRRVYLVFEFIDCKDLTQKLNRDGVFSEEKAAKVIKELLETLDYIHHQGIAHRDVKLDNLMVDDSKVKLIDFGLACPNINQGSTTKCGTPGYVAPEVLKGQVYNSKVDLFSAGVVLFAMLFGKLPFSSNGIKEVLTRNEECRVKFPKNQVSEEAIDLLKKLLQADPSRRPNASDAINHPWIRRKN